MIPSFVPACLVREGRVRALPVREATARCGLRQPAEPDVHRHRILHRPRLPARQHPRLLQPKLYHGVGNFQVVRGTSN